MENDFFTFLFEIISSNSGKGRNSLHFILSNFFKHVTVNEVITKNVTHLLFNMDTKPKPVASRELWIRQLEVPPLKPHLKKCALPLYCRSKRQFD